MSQDEAAQDKVRGERDSAAVNRIRSVQSRLSSVLAIALMSVLGLGTLTWYYANAMMSQTRAKQRAQLLSSSRAQGEMALPALGRIDPPAPREWPPRDLPPQDSPAQSPLMPSTLTEIPYVAGGASGAYLSSRPAATSNVPKTAAQIAEERRLSGPVFTAPALYSAAALNPLVTPIANATNPSIGAAGELSALLQPSVATAVKALVLPTQRLLLPKGAFIDCTLETAIDSTLPGMTTCVLASDTFGVDGQVVLLERGTKLVGETRGQVQQGAARLFVLWTEARTPTGVIVPLDSPGADELGRAGLPGKVNRHFWERFGAALMVSVIDGAMQAAVQSSRAGSGTVVLSPASSQGVLTEVLKSTVNISPTVVKRHGDRIQVLVARDLDFRSVYELRSVASAH